jgi:FkbM family methyltransferase
MVLVDDSPFGSRKPGLLDRLVLAGTQALPNTYLGLRLAILLRRITTMRLGEAPLDVEHFGLHLRLYPVGNGCEKALLFTPQMYETVERRILAEEIDHVTAGGRAFAFVDVGANVGLFSLLVAAFARGRARALAIEPQPGVADRLAFNVAANPNLDVRPLRIAAADREGEVDLFIDGRDLGASRIGGSGGDESTRVRARKLLDILVEEGFTGADLMKIDVEGAEDFVLEPFLKEAAEEDLPATLLLESNARRSWARDVPSMLAERGYAEVERWPGGMFFRR